MKYRVRKCLLVLLVLVSSSSCPPAAIVSISPGVWVFTFTDGGLDGQIVALTLKNGSQTQTPNPLPPGSTNFNGTLKWVQSGSTFMLSQALTGNSSAYAGTVETPSSITNGLYGVEGEPAGTFVAEKL